MRSVVLACFEERVVELCSSKLILMAHSTLGVILATNSLYRHQQC